MGFKGHGDGLNKSHRLSDSWCAICPAWTLNAGLAGEEEAVVKTWVMVTAKRKQGRSTLGLWGGCGLDRAQ
jgi:hypothetical protein